MKIFKYIPAFLFILLLAAVQSASAQILDPVKWEFSKSQTGPNEYVLVFKATIDKGWKVYATDIGDGGPIPTDIIFESKKGFKTVGKLEQLGNLEGPEYEPLFDMDLKWFKKTAIIRQKVKLNEEKVKVTGYVEYMTCDDQQCLPPTEVPFEFILTGSPEKSSTSQTPDPITPDEDETATLEERTDEDTAASATGIEMDSTDALTIAVAKEGEGGDEEKKKSMWEFLLAGLGGGLIALLTPCVFPMIPLTVSFFTKSSKNRRKGVTNAVIYALSIIIIFVALGFLLTIAFGPDTLNAMASNIYFNIIFFVVFILFALSFFGAFELTLPSSFVNKVDSASEKGGLLGIFFMAFTLVLVSFSCTVPIVGSMLVLIFESGEFWAPMMGMFGFSLALAIPFALFAIFPTWLQSLPKSGSWLNTVKVTLGFVELALALKFLSVVDLAYHWNFLTRDIFIALWIIIAILLGVYLLGKLKFSHEATMEHVTIPRLFFAILAFGFAIYLIPGLWGAPVKLLSGIAPPQHYQEFSLNKLQFQIKQLENQINKIQTRGGVAIEEENANGTITPIASDPATKTENMECPHELDCYFDYDKALAIAKRENKPLLIDFTGWACVNCRKMEDYVWSDPKVWETINEKYILVSLYVDDKTSLPEDKQVSKYTNNKVSTVGKLWSDFQTQRFRANSQPYYVLMDHQENVLVKPPKGYTPSVSEYLKYLEKGLTTFAKRQINQQAQILE